MNNVLLIETPHVLSNLVHNTELQYNSTLYNDLIDHFISITKKRLYDINDTVDSDYIDFYKLINKIAPYMTIDDVNYMLNVVTNILMTAFIMNNYMEHVIYHMDSNDIAITFNCYQLEITNNKGVTDVI